MKPPYSRTLYDLICEQADRHPDREAVVSGPTRYTYAKLRERAAMAAGGLHAIGIKRHDRVGLLLNNRAEWIEVCLGAAAIGAVLVPFSTWSKRRELEFLFQDSRIKALISADKLGAQNFASDIEAIRSAHPTLTAVLVGDSGLPGSIPYAKFMAQPPLREPPPPGDGARADDPALVLYTSGSTSYPKAVPLLHHQIIENGFNIGERQGLTPEDRVLLSPPLFWSYGSANAMVATFGHGATLVLQGRFEAGEALDLIETEQCTALYTMPSMTAAMLSHKDFRRERTRTLRKGVTIGTPQDVAIVANELGAREISNIYGQTESCGNCAVTWHYWPLERRMNVQGPPLPGVSIRIVDEATGQPVGPNTPGQIEVKGNVTPGYDGVSAENNAKAFTADGYFRTGDMGQLTPEGWLVFLARTTEMVKRAGINIAPAEVEEVLRTHPDVLEAGVVGAADPKKGEIVVAFVVARTRAHLTEETLRAYCRAEAASYKTPDRVEIVESLPATATGKLMRNGLKEMAAKLPKRSK